MRGDTSNFISHTGAHPTDRLVWSCGERFCLYCADFEEAKRSDEDLFVNGYPNNTEDEE